MAVLASQCLVSRDLRTREETEVLEDTVLKAWHLFQFFVMLMVPLRSWVLWSKRVLHFSHLHASNTYSTAVCYLILERSSQRGSRLKKKSLTESLSFSISENAVICLNPVSNPVCFGISFNNKLTIA